MNNNTISYKNLKNWYLENPEAKQNAQIYFGKTQPSIYRTGFYSSSLWNWGYMIGLCLMPITTDLGDGKRETTMQTFEVVTKFGQVIAARKVYIPEVEVTQ